MDIDIDIDGLLVALPELRRHSEERTRAGRESGAAARLAGVHISDDPWQPGSWYSNRWLEGWSGTAAPERTVTIGKGFNMTPTEEYFARMEWMAKIGVSAPRIREAMKVFRLGYTPDALPAEQ
jgi:hypothetical protein